MHCETLSASVSALIMTTGISLLSGSLDYFENLVPVHIRHHQIEQDETEFFLLDQRNRFVSTGCASDPLVTIAFEHQLQRVSIVLIVIDNKDAREIRKDAREIRCHEHLEL